jgi:hypothetical protein
LLLGVRLLDAGNQERKDRNDKGEEREDAAAWT